MKNLSDLLNSQAATSKPFLLDLQLFEVVQRDGVLSGNMHLQDPRECPAAASWLRAEGDGPALS